MKLSREEFERLALEHLDMLYRIARRLTGGDPAAGAVQERTGRGVFADGAVSARRGGRPAAWAAA